MQKNEEATELVFLFQTIIEEKAEFLSQYLEIWPGIKHEISQITAVIGLRNKNIQTILAPRYLLKMYTLHIFKIGLHFNLNAKEMVRLDKEHIL